VIEVSSFKDRNADKMSVGSQMVVVLEAFVKRCVSLALGHSFEFSWLEVSQTDQYRRRNQKCPGNLLRGQAADFAQGERNLSLRRQRAMAASEDQTEAIIFDLLVIFISTEGSFVDVRFGVERKISPFSVGARAVAHPIDGLEARR
jgi:hypothetical protein